MLAPLIETYSNKINIQAVDIDSEHVLTTKYNVRQVPTVVVLNPDGKEISRQSGQSITKEYLDKACSL